MKPRRFVPALGFHWLTPCYDWLFAGFMSERRLRDALVAGLQLKPGQSVLDLGCGTATLLLEMHRACPDARFWGLDVDPRILKLARAKLAQAEAPIGLVRGDAACPPFADGSLQRVVSCLVFHHLPAEVHLPMLQHARALLAPGGEMHLIDFGPPRGLHRRLGWLGERLLDGWSNTADSFLGRVPAMLEGVGYADVREVQRVAVPMGVVYHYRAARGPETK